MKRLARKALSLLLMVSLSLVGILVTPPAARAAAIAHSFTEVTAPQTTTSASQVDITGATIASSFFTAGKKYLIVTQAIFNINAVNGQGDVRTLHGTTLFDTLGSKMDLEPNQSSDYANYGFMDIWTAISGEGIKMAFLSNSGETVTVDQVTLFAMNLSDDLTENTDWLSSTVVADTNLSTAWSTTNNASVTFTPPAGTDWLVLANAQITGNDGAVNFESRIESSGTYTETVPFHSQEGEIVTGKWLFHNARVFTALGAVSQTFTEQARIDTGTATGPRKHSKIFALNLNKFKEHTSVWTAALLDVAATPNFDTNTATVSMTPSVAGDVWSGYAHTFNADGTGQSARIRLQVDNADQPDTQTSDALLEGSANDATDEMFLYRQSVDSVTAASHTWDVDASCETATAGRGVRHRSLWAVTMELADGAPPPAGKPIRPPIVIGVNGARPGRAGERRRGAESIGGSSTPRRYPRRPCPQSSHLDVEDSGLAGEVFQRAAVAGGGPVARRPHPL